MRHTKHVALVTGGMGGLGEAIAKRLFDADFTVHVTHSMGNDHVAQWLSQQEAAGRRFLAYEVDVSDYGSCQRCAKRINEDSSHVDVLVNNAGITRDITFRKMSKLDWDAVLGTNLTSVFNMTKPFCEEMASNGWGRIVNISSVNGAKGAFGQTNYCAAKAGVHGFTKALALEMARYGVTVNTVAPGYIATSMVTSIDEEVMRTKILPQIPLGRLGQPDEVAALVAYLCSDEGGFITGAEMAINGGMHMR